MYNHLKNIHSLNKMDVVSMDEFAETIYQMKKEARKKDEEIESLKKKIKELEQRILSDDLHRQKMRP